MTMQNNLRNSTGLLHVAVGVLLFILIFRVSIWGYPNFNQQIFLALNAMGTQGNWFWQNVTMLGEGLVAFVLLACFSPRDGRFLWALLIGAVIAGSSSQLLKHWLEMPRPAAILEPGSFNLIGAELRSRAFPSGHATTAFVAASMAAWRFPRLRIAAYAFFSCVAFSRIVVGAHWPLDVVAGGCLGFLSGQAAGAIAARYLKKVSLWAQYVAWLLLIALSVWLLFFHLDYPAAKLLTQLTGTAGIVTALVNIRALLRK
jgi:membrane-associated phospholipid phosphatase